MKHLLFILIIGLNALRSPWKTMGAESTKPLTPQEWSIQMAEALIKRHPAPWTLDEGNPNRWEYTYGLMFKALLEIWKITENPKYFEYVEKYYDNYVDDSGQIRTYRLEEYNIDRINPGKPLFKLFEVTGKEKYRRAIELLRSQMRTHPRTQAGGFWHKQIYPNQMWLDGIYMASPFLAEYAYRFQEPELYDEVAHQVILMYRVALDTSTGLLYHGWDESRQQRWADPKTGCSPNFWGRALGWYSMAIVDVLDFLPIQHPQRQEIIRLWQQLARAIRKAQDSHTGLWYQVLDKPQAPGNYLESSAACMFVYAFTKSVRLGYLDTEFLKAARQGYQGILEKFITTDKQGLISITQACAVAGLGGKPYRDGSYEYYISTPKSINDPKAMGPFILAGLELEKFNNR
jgi:unsaturated rhamnogalacturonyl hydrolase